MADKLRDKLIEALVQSITPELDRDSPRANTAWRVAAQDVDTILTTLAEEEPDEAMLDAAETVRSGSVSLVSTVNAHKWKAMTAALRDGGETDG